MAYVVTPLVNWNSIRRAVSGGAARLRREALALGVIGGGAISGRFGGRQGGASPSPSSTRDRRAGVVGGTGDASVATACAECGVDPARVSETVAVCDQGALYCSCFDVTNVLPLGCEGKAAI